jgi:hypothetical protein
MGPWDHTDVRTIDDVDEEDSAAILFTASSYVRMTAPSSALYASLISVCVCYGRRDLSRTSRVRFSVA